jgi:hypothetical protein
MVGEVFSGAWDLYKRFWRHLVPIALVIFGVIAIVTFLLVLAIGAVGAVFAAILSIVGILWLQAALVIAVQDVRDGRVDLSIGETLSRVSPHLAALIGAGFLIGLGFAAAAIIAVLIFPVLLILVFVAFLYALTRWAVVVPAIVLENLGVFDAFRRSQALVRGHGWSVFGVILLAIVIQLIGSLIISIIFVWLPADARSFVQSLVANTLLTPYIAAAWTLMYFRLRGETDTVQPEPAPAL